jgi:hypothetical protein
VLFYLIVYDHFFFTSTRRYYREEFGQRFVSLHTEHHFFRRQTLKVTAEVFLVSLNNQSKFQIIHFVRLCFKQFFHLSDVCNYLHLPVCLALMVLTVGFFLLRHGTSASTVSSKGPRHPHPVQWDSTSRHRSNHCITRALQLRSRWCEASNN